MLEDYHDKYRPVDRVRRPLARRLLGGRKVITLGLVAILLAVAGIHIWQNVHMMALSSEVRRLEKENHNLADLIKKTRTKITEVSRPGILGEIASARLELSPTPTENLFTLVRDQIKIEPGPLDNIKITLKKIAENMPVITETQAADKEVYLFDEK